MTEISQLAQEVIRLFQKQLDHWQITPVIHFELEGGYKPPKIAGELKHNIADFSLINHQLNKLNIFGEVKAEYWRNQWEYVSLFNGQAPLKEAQDLDKAIAVLPTLFKQQGIEEVYIKPVLWSGDNARIHNNCQSIFSLESQLVHIPNAIQLNISANDSLGNNMVPNHGFGEILQQCLLNSSYACCLLFLPESEAFERLQLKNQYQLEAELSSPHDISGGHQGSIALYKEHGKNNQRMGQSPLIYGKKSDVLLYKDDWRSTSRVEHRLGASSMQYNAYVNVAFALGNLCDAVDIFKKSTMAAQTKSAYKPVELPRSLNGDSDHIGALELFIQDTWFVKRIEKTFNELYPIQEPLNSSNNIGEQLKQAIISSYLPKKLISH